MDRRNWLLPIDAGLQNDQRDGLPDESQAPERVFICGLTFMMGCPQADGPSSVSVVSVPRRIKSTSHRQHLPTKDIWVYPLRRDFHRILQA